MMATMPAPLHPIPNAKNVVQLATEATLANAKARKRVQAAAEALKEEKPPGATTGASPS